MAKIIVNDQGRINTFLAAINDEDIITIAPHGDGKVLVAVKSEAAPIGEPIIQEKVIEIDNPEHLRQLEKLKNDNLELSDLIEFKDDEIKTLKSQIVAFTKENGELNKELEDCKKECKALKASNTKLKKALEAIE